jgi:hypothetical protein
MRTLACVRRYNIVRDGKTLFYFELNMDVHKEIVYCLSCLRIDYNLQFPQSADHANYR